MIIILLLTADHEYYASMLLTFKILHKLWSERGVRLTSYMQTAPFGCNHLCLRTDALETITTHFVVVHCLWVSLDFIICVFFTSDLRPRRVFFSRASDWNFSKRTKWSSYSIIEFIASSTWRWSESHWRLMWFFSFIGFYKRKCACKCLFRKYRST